MLCKKHFSAGSTECIQIHFHLAHCIPLLVVACMGAVCNSLSAVVWFKDVKTKNSTAFLCYLSVADAVVCLTLILVKCVELNFCQNCIIHILEEPALTFSFISRYLIWIYWEFPCWKNQIMRPIGQSYFEKDCLKISCENPHIECNVRYWTIL